VSIYSRGDKNIVRMSKRFETCVSAMKKFCAVGYFLGLWTPDRASL
jgi:hypothetical protein